MKKTLKANGQGKRKENLNVCREMKGGEKRAEGRKRGGATESETR